MFFINHRVEFAVVSLLSAMLLHPAQAGELEATSGSSQPVNNATSASPGSAAEHIPPSAAIENQAVVETPSRVQSTEEKASAFLERYFAAIGTAKSASDLSQFYDDADKVRKEPTLNPMVRKAMDDFALSCIKQEPTKVKILSEANDRSGGLRFSLVPAAIPPAYESASRKPGFSMTGSVVLIKRTDGWKVYKDYWVVKAKDKFGVAETSFGKDPDGEHEKEQKASAPPPAKNSSRNPEADYQHNFRERLMDSWNPPGSGKVHAAFKVSASGGIGTVSAKDEKHSKAAEDYVRQRIMALKTVGNLPPGFKTKPHVWMYFDWSSNAKAISGPYFEDQFPDFISYDLGFKKKPYDGIIVDKLMNALKNQTDTGSAVVFLKLKPNGAIEKIFVKTDPPNPNYEKKAYDVVGRAHPFGPLPPAIAKNPYFRCWVNWGPSAGASAGQLDDPPKWLK